MKEIVRTAGLTKKFGSLTAVKDFNFSVKEGDIYGLIGPNGSGKTTTVRIICGLLLPTTGEVYVLGRKMPDYSILPKISYMPQKNAVYTDLTVEENLRFFGQLQGLSSKEIKKRTDELLALVKLEGKRSELTSRLSGGMERRLSLIVSLIPDPELLLLDEPTAGVDPDLRILFWQSLKKLAEHGTTLLITTHYLEEAARCNRIGLMRKGQLIREAPPESLTKDTGSKSLEEAFLKLVGG